MDAKLERGNMGKYDKRCRIPKLIKIYLEHLEQMPGRNSVEEFYVLQSLQDLSFKWRHIARRIDPGESDLMNWDAQKEGYDLLLKILRARQNIEHMGDEFVKFKIDMVKRIERVLRNQKNLLLFGKILETLNEFAAILDQEFKEFANYLFPCLVDLLSIGNSKEETGIKILNTLLSLLNFSQPEKKVLSDSLWSKEISSRRSGHFKAGCLLCIIFAILHGHSCRKLNPREICCIHDRISEAMHDPNEIVRTLARWSFVGLFETTNISANSKENIKDKYIKQVIEQYRCNFGQKSL